MSITYNDLFIRGNLQSDGTLPQSGTVTSSPDLITYGINRVAHPQTIFSANYGSNPSKDLALGETNNIYLRAKNLSDGANTGTIALYVSTTQDLGTPSSWTQLTTSGGDDTQKLTAAATDDIAVAAEAFQWDVPADAATESYNLIAWLQTKADPNPLPRFIANFENRVRDNGNVGWLIPSYAPPVVGKTWSSEINYVQLSEQTMTFTLSCKNIPVGSSIQLDSSEPGPNPAIQINETEVSNPDTFTASVITDVTEGFKTNLTYTLYGKGTLPAGSSITLTAGYIETPGGGGPSREVIVTSATTTNGGDS